MFRVSTVTVSRSRVSTVTVSRVRQAEGLDLRYSGPHATEHIH